jgi:hypothetical protein
MFGKAPRLSPTELRKRLLVAESEINRAQMLTEWRGVADDLRHVSQRIGSISSMGSVAAELISRVFSSRRTKAEPPDAKPSWLQTALKAAQLASDVWLAFRKQQR